MPEYKNYIARKRAKFDAACGPVDIPYGTELTAEGGYIRMDDQIVKKGRLPAKTPAAAIYQYCLKAELERRKIKKGGVTKWQQSKVPWPYTMA